VNDNDRRSVAVTSAGPILAHLGAIDGVLHELVESENARREADRELRLNRQHDRDLLQARISQVDRAVSRYHRHLDKGDWPRFEIPLRRAA
jgi:hypothetical protein